MKSLFLSLDNIKTMVNQYKNNQKQMIIASYKPKNDDKTYVLISELGEVQHKKGYWLFWKNKDEMNDPEIDRIQKALQEAGLPF